MKQTKNFSTVSVYKGFKSNVHHVILMTKSAHSCNQICDYIGTCFMPNVMRLQDNR